MQRNTATRFKMHALHTIGATVLCTLGWRAAAHPLCYYDDKPTDPDMDMTFCPAQDDGACCNEVEEMAVIDLYNAASTTPLTGDCAEYYKEVVCGPCNAYSAHLYERLGVELGAEDGMTMKGSFCSELVNACAGQINFPTYEGESYCDKHVGGSEDALWSYPIDPGEMDFTSTGLIDAFPDLSEDELPSKLITMRMTPDGSEWWLGGQTGQLVKIPSQGATSTTPVMDMGNDLGLNSAYEEGLIDFAFSPAFDTNNYIYVSYTIEDSEGTKNRLSRFTYDSSSTTATKDSVDVLLTTGAKATAIHSSGWVGFKPSDYNSPAESSYDIFWSVGDGGPQLDTDVNGPNLDNLLATIVRISVPAGTGPGDTGYTIPPGNRQGGMGEICANGFRNPFRCGFDSETDELYCGDVGHIMVEEIDLIECGNDYGWSRFEGSRCQEAVEDRYGDCAGASRAEYTFPVYEYCHPDYYSTDGGEDEFTNGKDICGSRALLGNAIIGGYVYRGQRFSEVLNGALLFSDYQNKNLYYLVKDGDEWVPGTIISDGSAAIVSFAVDNNGEHYVITAQRKPYTLPCGDLCSTTCLDQSGVMPVYTSLGCFGDEPNDRALQLEEAPQCSDGEKSMSPTVCASFCQTVPGAEYFGLEFADECYCGAGGEDYDKHGSLSAENCGALCVGNPDQTCGGYGAIEVFSFESGQVDDDDDGPPPIPSTPTPVGSTPAPVGSPPTPVGSPPTPVGSPPTPVGPTPTPTEYTYKGCFADSKTNRVLSGGMTESTILTAEVCAAICDGSDFFGTQSSHQCFCSDDGDEYDELGTATCDMECAGEPSEMCGGIDAVSVYEFDGPASPPTPMPTPDSYEFVGCYVDSSASRTLSSSETTSSSMTTEFCADYCTGSTHFGTEYSTQCFCGSPSSLGATSTSCSYECAGDSGETCGGIYAISVYKYTGTSGMTYLGCYADDKDSRAMTLMTTGPDMTNELCASDCDGYVYFGTQHGEECWCGDSDYDIWGSSMACTTTCAGDSSSVCGGVDALSVYEI